MANKLITLVVGMMLLATTAQAQENAGETTAKPDTPPQCAFGFCMGQSINKKPKGKNDAGLWYVSKEHDLFEEVAAFWTNSTGVCEVRGYYVVPSPDDYGNAHRRAFNMLSDLVTRKYGEPTDTFDYISHEAFWKEPMYWLKALETGERMLKSFWIEEPSVLPPGLTIRVEADSSLIVVGYQFANYDECMEEGKSALADDF